MSTNPNKSIKETIYYSREAALADWETEIVQLPSEEFKNATPVYRLTHHYELQKWHDSEKYFGTLPPPDDVKMDCWTYVLVEHKDSNP